MTDQQITEIAREYAEEMCAHMEDDFIKDEAIRDNELAFQIAVNHLLQRYCLVEKSKLIELEIARRVKEHHAVWLNQWEAEYLLPEIAKEIEE